MAEMKDVVDKLAKLTDKGQVLWKTTVDKSTFAATFGRMSVLISGHGPRLGSSATEYRLSVLDEQGDEIDFTTASWGPSVTGVMLPPIVPLYDSAKRTAIGVDRRLEELLSEMDRVSGS